LISSIGKNVQLKVTLLIGECAKLRDAVEKLCFRRRTKICRAWNRESKKDWGDADVDVEVRGERRSRIALALNTDFRSHVICSNFCGTPFIGVFQQHLEILHDIQAWKLPWSWQKSGAKQSALSVGRLRQLVRFGWKPAMRPSRRNVASAP
jgi:hypothetical protein